jgi:hypothetical protein
VIRESTSSYLASLAGERVHGGGDVTRVVRVDRVKGVGEHHHTQDAVPKILS